MQPEKKIVSSAPIGLSEYDAITKTVQIYIDAGKSGSGADMSCAFHPQPSLAISTTISLPGLSRISSIGMTRMVRLWSSRQDYEHRYYRDGSNGAARARELVRPPVHRFVYAAQAGWRMEDHE
jgi:hypothetical protein